MGAEGHDVDFVHGGRKIAGNSGERKGLKRRRKTVSSVFLNRLLWSARRGGASSHRWAGLGKESREISASLSGAVNSRKMEGRARGEGLLLIGRAIESGLEMARRHRKKNRADKRL
jgi:hypothetical protein